MSEVRNNEMQILIDIIKDFDPEKFTHFFRDKNRSFAPRAEDLFQYDDDNFRNGKKLGEIQFAQGEKMLICAFEANNPLSERSGKKAQYEKGKRILKDSQSDAGIFIFHDTNDNFRFSLIYAEYLGVRRRFSYFKRLTFFVSPRLTNKTFLQQIGECDFSNLENIKEAFSVEPVTKQFYGELQYWYFWAMDKIKFPDDYKYSPDPSKDKEIRNATNLIRLITRIIFIRFLSEKGLIPPELFSGEKLGRIVKDLMKGKKASNFYNAILQNLFFGTLNQKMKERKFVQESGFQTNRNEYGVKNLYRYGDKFSISKVKVLELFKDIPFLNGGLFDCLDKDDESSKVIYVDGFSRNPAKQSIIPDYLFFQQEEERVDLSGYGLGKGRPVRGLIEILNSYNFTIDENTPIDQEIALDPELLGKVFENLLASYNPETATTARKATGSYYTPREIVDYMVQESLFAYLQNKLPSPLVGEGKGEGDNDSRLRQLLSYSEDIPEISEPERQKIISAIDDIKILDPACGSGAFPMGILHKLVYALQKLDPQNKYWHELQYQKALKESEEVFKQDDKNERQERLKEINEAFDEGINYPDYARKLYLIENCIYGVDIQPIAIQISKLRFFISLVLDQKVDRGKENLGIRALPNLETKFVAANTLIGLDRPAQLAFRNPEIEKKEHELKQIRHKYFNAKTRTEKTRYQKEDKKLREKLSNEIKRILIKKNDDDVRNLEQDLKQASQELNNIINQPEEIEIIENTNLFGEKEQIRINKKLKRIKNQKKVIKYIEELLNLKKNPPENTIDKVAKKIATFDLYDQNASAEFFDPEWMFGVASNSPLTKGDTGGCGGFDIVIGNPPYKILTKNNTLSFELNYLLQNYRSIKRSYSKNLFTLFIERGINILSTQGVLSFIVPEGLFKTRSYAGCVEVVQNNGYVKSIATFTEYVFENAITGNLIFVFLKGKKGITENYHFDKNLEIGNAEQKEDRIIQKIQAISFTKPLRDVATLFKGMVVKDRNLFLSDNSKSKKNVFLLGKNISKWKLDSRFFTTYENLEIIGGTKQKAKHDYYPRILIRRTGNTLCCTLLEEPALTESTLYSCWSNTENISNKYLLALFNSRLLDYYVKTMMITNKQAFPQILMTDLEELPIIVIDDKKQQPFITLVDQILSVKKQHTPLSPLDRGELKDADTSTLEKQIDEMVYALYGLTPEEIAIVEGQR